MVIKKNNLAPFDGVLIPDATYRKMQVDIFAGIKIQKTYEECENEKVLLAEQSKFNETLWFAGGLGLGLLSTFLFIMNK